MWIRAFGHIRVVTAAAALLVAILPGHDTAAQEIKIATIAPDGSGWMREMREGAEQIRAATEGRVVFKFYPGGVMGDDAQVLRRIRIGQLQGGAFTVGGLSDRYRALSLYGIPLLFHSLDEVDFVRSELDPVLMDGLRGAGFVSFGFVEGGFAQLMSNAPVRSVEDMTRKKVWIPEGDVISSLSLEAMGLSPVVLPVTDVLTGLQTGLLDVVASSPVAALVLQWHTKVRYITDLPILYSMGVLAIDQRAFEDLSRQDQDIVTEIMTEVVSSLDRVARQDNARALEAMLDTGIELVAVDRTNVSTWRSQIETIYPALRERPDTDRAFLDRLLALLADYRAGSAR
jgi:TRAP-type C4-dicarboxylate transport system substrate-binding protein